jgi:hypothetical protein
MRIHHHILVLLVVLAVISIFLSTKAQSQSIDTTRIINFPLPSEDFSLYDFADVRFEFEKTETLPYNRVNKNFQPLKRVFQKDSLHFGDSVQTVWIKFTLRNKEPSDAAVSLLFPIGVNKAVLYKSEEIG